jgi:hypothetical protein
MDECADQHGMSTAVLPVRLRSRSPVGLAVLTLAAVALVSTPARAMTPYDPHDPHAAATGVGAQTLTQLNRIGAMMGVRCAQRCQITATLILDARQARRFGWTTDSDVVLGTLTRSFTDHSGANVKLNALAHHRLARIRSAPYAISVRLVSSATFADGTVTAIPDQLVTITEQALTKARARQEAGGVLYHLHYDLPNAYRHAVDSCARQGPRRFLCRRHIDSVGLIRCTVTLSVSRDEHDDVTWKLYGEPTCRRRA